jgi:hypothetical protein
VATANTSGATVTMADVYGLLLTDIRRNRSVRLAREAEAAQRDRNLGNDATAQPGTPNSDARGACDVAQTVAERSA